MLMLYNFIVTEIKILFSIEISSCYYLYQSHNYSQISLRSVRLIESKIKGLNEGRDQLQVSVLQRCPLRESPLFSLQLQSAFSRRSNTVNPLLSPSGSFISSSFEGGGGVIETGGLILENTMVSVLLKELEYKVEKLKYKKVGGPVACHTCVFRGARVLSVPNTPAQLKTTLLCQAWPITLYFVGRDEKRAPLKMPAWEIRKL